MSKRVATNRNFIDKSIEYIELHDNGVFFWVAEDLGNFKNMPGRWLPDDCDLIATSFPVDVEFVREFFAKIGRTFDVTKLPSNVVQYPYGS